MKQLTLKEFNTLRELIYDKLMESEEMGMGEMGECRDEAERIINEWCETENIEIEDN